jgi:hypothetical protein
VSQSVAVTTRVAVPPGEAFARFTGEIGAWWAARTLDGARWHGSLSLEPGLGGRLLKEVGGRSFELGRVSAWEPPARFAFECREPGDASSACTEVEVRFREAAQGTRVTLVHSGFERLAADHPARAGLGHEALLRLWGQCWSERLARMQECAALEGR